MAKNYHQLYHDFKKSANFFSPNIHIQDDIYILKPNKKNIDEQLPLEAPRDYSDNAEYTAKK